MDNLYKMRKKYLNQGVKTMKRIHLEREFNLSPEHVWEMIVDPDHYRNWSEAFHEGSDFDGKWIKGNKIRFISEDENGLQTGMLSVIEECNYPAFISIKHIGLVMNGIEDYESEETKRWTPAYENYTLTASGESGCLFALDQDMLEEEIQSFIEMWERSFDYMQRLIDTQAPLGKVITLREKSSLTPEEIWEKLVIPDKVMTWNFASEDWHCPKASNELKIGGEFHYEMASKEGNMSFDFWGSYTVIEPSKKLYFSLGDGRLVRIDLKQKSYGTLIEERFEAETTSSLDLQRQGWQNILTNLACH